MATAILSARAGSRLACLYSTPPLLACCSSGRLLRNRQFATLRARRVLSVGGKGALTVAAAGVGGSWLWLSTTQQRNVTETDTSKEVEELWDHLSWRAAWRMARVSGALAIILTDYSLLSFANEDEKDEKKKVVHLRSAERMLKLFLSLGGLYLKAGQQIASLPHILPVEYTSTLAVCQDKANSMDIDDVKAVFAEDLGENAMEEMFESFDEKPLAAASLAQVHHARLKSGDEVAVKVQYRYLKGLADSDIATIAYGLKIVKMLFPGFEFGWLIDEFKCNLPKELDFRVEAENGRRCAKMFEGRADVHVPAVVRDEERLLVMEYIDGCKVNDVGGLARMGVKRGDVSKLLSETIFEQIFVHGFVHCDPHPGNIMVRALPNKGRSIQPQIVLLDHGLYRELTDSFRHTYARLWKSLITGDVQGIKTHSEQLGVGEQFELLSMMMTERSWEAASQGKLETNVSSNEKGQLQDIGVSTAPEITRVLGRLPRQMILLFKCIDLLRGVDRDLQVAKGLKVESDSQASSSSLNGVGGKQLSSSAVMHNNAKAEHVASPPPYHHHGDHDESVSTYLIMLKYCLHAIHEADSGQSAGENESGYAQHGYVASLSSFLYRLYLRTKLAFSILGVNIALKLTGRKNE